MAEIKIQEKQGSNWLWWAIGLVVLALLAWWLIAANSRQTVVGEGDVVATPAAVATSDPMTATAPTGAITDITTLTAATSASEFAGRPVMLSNVPVATAVSDKAFWAGSGSAANDRILVVRGNQSASYTAPDGAVNAGTHAMIFGTVQAMPADLTQQATEWNLASTDKQALATRPLYIMADSVRLAP